MARLLLLLIALPLLSACNVVLTEKPLFAQSDAASAPPLRPGVWEFFREPGCEVDQSQPFYKWPDCAGAGLVSADGSWAGHKKGAAPDALERQPVVIAGGDPRILQVQLSIDLSAGAQASASGDAEATASASVTPAKAAPWAYGGVKPTKWDNDGRITAFRFWSVLCGPPPPKNKDGSDSAAATLHPFKGLEMKPGDSDCTTHSVEVLRNAAKASEAFDTDHHEAHWLRDGDK